MSPYIGMDTSEKFAYYLFRAGKLHAGHGPRQIHVPPAYITTSIGMMGAAFARCMYEANLPGDVVALAMAGWNKYLSVQLHLMDLGYRVAIEFSRGDFPVSYDLYGRMRQLAGWRTIKGSASEGETLESGGGPACEGGENASSFQSRPAVRHPGGDRHNSPVSRHQWRPIAGPGRHR